MKKIKKILLTVSVIFIIVLAWGLYSYSQYGELRGEGNTGATNWTASYIPDKSVKEIWRGDLTWEQQEGKITKYEFIKDGQIMSTLEDNKSINMASKGIHSFASIGEPPIKGSEYKLVIFWEVNGETFNEEIQLKYKNSFFVIPRIFYTLSN
ncbi:hypothetical protein [Bacillus sp. THAF10]|uniref:hypothetical protein n=1 Tax=Bacillus sp. THAF10 TaxID=2587848 RepID=UPI001268F8CC|nr:hypothetical protein [Bacillus sp. THAF10]